MITDRQKEYMLVPLSGDCGKQYVTGYRDAMRIARAIAERDDTTVIVSDLTDGASIREVRV